MKITNKEDLDKIIIERPWYNNINFIQLGDNDAIYNPVDFNTEYVIINSLYDIGRVNIENMEKTEDWLNDKLFNYKHNPIITLEDMLSTTTDVIKQYINSPNLTSKEVLESCLKHNELFLSKLNETEHI